MLNKKNFFLLIFLVVNLQFVLAQETIVSGKVTDAENGDAIPFANVVFRNTTIGGTTDFDGYFKIRTTTSLPVDSVEVSYVGYEKRVKKIVRGGSQSINFQLTPQFINLDEVVVRPGENPAWPILRKVIDLKDAHNKNKLNAYEYEAYTKVEIDIDQISDKLRKRKMMKSVTTLLDSVSNVAGEDGKPVLPIFISETISQFYFRDNPKLRKEQIIKTKVRGVGVNNNTSISQLLGSTFQEYNFYNNYLNIVDKNFTSPISIAWRIIYDYDLVDSLMVGDDYCYRIDFFPKNAQDLAFIGTMWITKEEYALKQIDAAITPNANLNYVEKIKIQQELTKTSSGAWLPSKSRILLNISEMSEEAAGMLAKFYLSTKNIVVNEPKDPKFYSQSLVLEEDAMIHNEDYWDQKRHDSLTVSEKNVYAMIDTLNNLPQIRTYVDIVESIVLGYYRWGNLDWGPYLFTYANNNIEGNRIRIGLSTNKGFSSKWILSGYAAYGTLDQEWKYGAGVDYIISRSPWTMAGIQHNHDIDLVGLQSAALQNNYIFYTFSRFGTLTKPYMSTVSSAYFKTEIIKGVTQKISFSHQQFDPLYNFNYYETNSEGVKEVRGDFATSEITLETRLARDEIFIQTDLDRESMGTVKWPIFTFGYTLGIKGIGGSDFNYHKAYFNVTQLLRWGIIGSTRYNFESAYIFNTLPYPLLKTHIGNESLFYTSAAFSQMNYFEFVSDAYASLKVTHYFEGFFFNRIPLIKKLKWRNLATFNVLYGSIRPENVDMATPDGLDAVPFFQTWEKKPYMEVGYGIENIFKIGRIDAFHRLTYLDRPNVSNFGVKLTFQFIL